MNSLIWICSPRKRNPHVPPRLGFHLDRLEFRSRLTHSLIMGMGGQSRYCEIRLPRLAALDLRTLDHLTAPRGTGESYSDVILRPAKAP